jgi:hypothetical protein
MISPCLPESETPSLDSPSSAGLSDAERSDMFVGRTEVYVTAFPLWPPRDILRRMDEGCAVPRPILSLPPPASPKPVVPPSSLFARAGWARHPSVAAVVAKEAQRAPCFCRSCNFLKRVVLSDCPPVRFVDIFWDVFQYCEPGHPFVCATCFMEMASSFLSSVIGFIVVAASTVCDHLFLSMPVGVPVLLINSG